MGPYFTGRRTFTAVDAARGGRQVKIDVWYPAIRPEGYTGTVAEDALPDPSGAPYPLILSSSVMARVFAVHLISYGFTWASVREINTYRVMHEEMYAQPLDILFALDQVASSPPPGLEGIIDADHAGATGYSFDGYNTLAMSGARVDPAYYQAQCPTPDAITRSILLSLSAFNCGPADRWEDFEAGVGERITDSDDDLWQPMTDPRIRAVMPMAGEGWWLFGEKGLAAVNRPVLMLAARDDPLYPENALIFEHLGAPEKTFITFLGEDHMMVMETPMARRMGHFAVAFFGYHLQGRQDLQAYYSPAWVSQFEDLVWGSVGGL
jgi:predicted dienelactone hydrolase